MQMTMSPSTASEKPDTSAAAPHSDAASGDSSAVCNCLAIRQAARHVTQFYDRYMAREGLRATQYSILAKLQRLGPLSINELAAMMVMDRTTMGRAIRPLERDKLVAIDPGRDARMRLVRLTAAGTKRFAAASKRWREAQAAFEKAYGSSDAAALRDALSRVVTLS
jgi:DNA-binding MarR family transcriptional regulator